MALVDALLDDARRRGVKLSWGAGESAGVCGWYQIAGRRESGSYRRDAETLNRRVSNSTWAAWFSG
jgi:hypothetical protein